MFCQYHYLLPNYLLDINYISECGDLGLIGYSTVFYHLTYYCHLFLHIIDHMHKSVIFWYRSKEQEAQASDCWIKVSTTGNNTLL